MWPSKATSSRACFSQLRAWHKEKGLVKGRSVICWAPGLWETWNCLAVMGTSRLSDQPPHLWVTRGVMLTLVLSPSVSTSFVPHCHAQASSCSPCCLHRTPPHVCPLVLLCWLLSSPSWAALPLAMEGFLLEAGGGGGFPQPPVCPEVGGISALETLESWTREKGSRGAGGMGM